VIRGELRLRVADNIDNGEDRRLMVSSSDLYSVTFAQFTQPIKDGRLQIPGHMSSDDGWPESAGSRTADIPAGEAGVARHLHRSGAVESEPYQPGLHTQSANPQSHRLGRGENEPADPIRHTAAHRLRARRDVAVPVRR
jgi:hypothetical protein